MKKKASSLFFKTIAVVFTSVILNYSANAQWTPAGTTIGSPGGSLALAVNPVSGLLYAAYADKGQLSFVVQVFNGIEWLPLGDNNGFVNNGATPALACDLATGQVYIAYAEAGNNDFVVRTFDGEWSQVGSTLGFANDTASPALAFDPHNNQLYIAYPDRGSDAFIVASFDGSDWSQVGDAMGFVNLRAAASLAFSPADGLPYIAFPNGASNAFEVRRFEDPDWNAVGYDVGQAGHGVAPSLAFSPADSTPYIAFPNEGTQAFEVLRFDGTDWQPVGGDIGYVSAASTGIVMPSLAFNVDSAGPYIAYANGNAQAFEVRTFTNGDWNAVGEEVGYANHGTSPTLVFSNCPAKLYVGYPDGGQLAYSVQQFGSGCSLSITPPTDAYGNAGDTIQLKVSSPYSCASYQWQIDTGAAFQNLAETPIFSGTTNDTLTVSGIFTANSTQHFRCVVSSGTCSDTSSAAVISVVPLGTEESKKEHNLLAYPNPANDVINVVVGPTLLNANYTMTDIMGRIVLNGKLTSLSSILPLTALSTGMYFLKVGEYDQQECKLVKQ